MIRNMEDAVLDILEKRYPLLLKSLKNEARVKLSPHLDFNRGMIIDLFWTFCEYRKIDSLCFPWNQDVKTRRDMLAIMLLAFDPEKIHRLVDKRVKKGLLKEIALLTDVSQQVLTNDIIVICNYFQVYKMYKESTMSAFEKIIEKNYK